MHYEVLTEDKSGGIVVEALLRRLIASDDAAYSLSVRPHRGKGDLPANPYARPDRNKSGLLDLLPAKLRAYDRVYAGAPFVLIVVMDSDNLPFEQVHTTLKSMANKHAPGLSSVIGVCVEETESWLLADCNALLTAYPDADRNMLRQYEQDSVCGTWEYLCRVILRDRAAALIRVGYPAIGQYKNEWATMISPYLDPKGNCSPSFRAFSRELQKTMHTAEKRTVV